MTKNTPKTTSERYADFRAQIEPELAVARETSKTWNDVTVGEWARKETHEKRIRREKRK